MHLLFVCDRYPPEVGAHAASAARLAATLAALGHPVQVLAFAESQPPGRSAMQLAELNLTVHRFGPFADETLTAGQLLRLADWLNRRQRFDGVWAHGVGRSGQQATWLGRRLGVPVLLAVRGGDVDHALFSSRELPRIEWCLRAASLVAAGSADAAAQVRALVGRDATVLPNVVDSARFTPGPKPADLVLRYALPDDAAVIGYCGELSAAKGMAHIIKAFREIRAARPCRLLLIGDVATDDRAEFTREAARAPDRTTDILRTGRLSDTAQVARHLGLCDVLLLPSSREGQPNAVLEAMASGVAVVASDAGGLPELIEDGRTGVLVPRTHLHLFGRRVLELLDWSAERRSKVVEAARAAVVERHAPAAERERLATLLTEFSRSALPASVP